MISFEEIIKRLGYVILHRMLSLSEENLTAKESSNIAIIIYLIRDYKLSLAGVISLSS